MSFLIVAKTSFDATAALFALAAAYKWYRASCAPIPFITFPHSTDAPAVRAALDCYEGFQQGMKLNKQAARLTAISAFASFLSWIVNLWRA